MLYALRHPVALIALLLGFLIGVTVRGVVQARLAQRLGDRSAVAYGRGRLDPRKHLEPFGAIAAAIGGAGWGIPWERTAVVPRLGGRGRLIAVLVAGPVSMVVAGAVLLAGYVATGGPALVSAFGLSATLHGSFVAANPGQTLLLFAGVELVAMALLDIVPLPPLDGGRLLFLLAPRSIGWQQAEYRLAEQNWGVGILLVLLLLPLAGGVPLLLFLLDTILRPLLDVARL